MENREAATNDSAAKQNQSAVEDDEVVNGEQHPAALVTNLSSSINASTISSFSTIRSSRLVTPLFAMNMMEDLQIGRVYDWLLVSSEDVALNLEVLRENKVRRIVNLASMCENKFADELQYLRININDVPTARISDHFNSTFDFIEAARSAGEVCLVHCNAGISRSCSIAIAYAMRHEQLTFFEAFDKVSRVRPVCSPNFGFREQLRQLEAQLRLQSPQTYPASKTQSEAVINNVADAPADA